MGSPDTPVRRIKKVGKPCSASGKRKYADSVDVLLVNIGNPRPIRAYLCPDCGYWHAATKKPRP